ncbi:ammonium transporter Rh type B isoform X1 [Cinclus cinclus]|uniref:ammonium transporter Rh type B isoform X1 n=1 Tax=Cinclus cinclus TaxID=127875 RepID=UPI002E0E1E70
MAKFTWELRGKAGGSCCCPDSSSQPWHTGSLLCKTRGSALEEDFEDKWDQASGSCEYCPSEGYGSIAKAAARHLGGHSGPHLSQAQPSLCHQHHKALPVHLAGAVASRARAAGSAPVPVQLCPAPVVIPGSATSMFPFLPSIVSADFCTAAVLISTGAVLGRVNPVQMLLLALLEVTLYSLNEYILLSLMGVSDGGRSLTVHTFGAYFGLMVSRVLYQPHKDKRKREERQDTGHQRDVFAVVGTIYMWIFWPSFTSTTTVHDNAENWAVINTYFSLVASTVATFILSPVLYEESTPRMVQIQDATLAGMAVMGMAGEMLLTPFGALIAGFLVGLISPLGFRFFTPVLHSRLKIQDTCGVHNIHGLPGILGALLGTLLTLLATADTYGDRLEFVFPLVAQGSRTVTYQALMQLSALPLTLLLAALGGCLTGAVLKTKLLRCARDAQSMENTVSWEVKLRNCW